jgi:hypothetical protein
MSPTRRGSSRSGSAQRTAAGRCGSHQPGTTLEAGAHRVLACSAYASPSKEVYSVRAGHEGPMGTIWPIRDQQSGFDGGWKAWHEIDWHMLVDARLPPGDQGVDARATAVRW